VVIAFAAGCIAGQNAALHWLLAVLSAAVAGWVLLLRNAGIVPFAEAAAALTMQAASVAALLCGTALTRAGWLGGAIHGLGTINLIYWSLLLVSAARKKKPVFAVSAAALLGTVAAQCLPLLELILVQPRSRLLSELFGTVAGLLLVSFARRKRLGGLPGMYDWRYLTAL
jgi:hypothetical protein